MDKAEHNGYTVSSRTDNIIHKMPSRTAPSTIALTSDSPYRLDSAQVSRASNALKRKLQSDEATSAADGEKANLLADADTEDTSESKPIWLILTTKKHIIDKKRLKPGKIALPHPYTKSDSGESLRVCLITADPQRKYKDLVANPAFPIDTSELITRIIGLEKLRSRYKSYESKRQLLGEYDVFLADDRIITYLPAVLGKPFYKSSVKRPVPVSLEGRRQNIDEHGNKRRKLAEGGTKVTKNDARPAEVAAEIERALSSALVHLAPSTTTAVKVGIASMTAQQIQQNVEAVVAGLVEKYVPQKWRNVRAIHIKGATTIALPIWLTDELWTDAKEDIRAEPLPPYGVNNRKRKVTPATDDDGGPDVVEVPGADGRLRRISRPGTKKAKSVVDGQQELDGIARAARKESIRKQKAALSAGDVQSKTEGTSKVQKPTKKRAKTADLI